MPASPCPSEPSRQALIGHSGYVGSTLLRQARFGAQFRSATIAQIDGASFDRIVCAGAPGQKWLANRDPATDLASIERLMGHLERVVCRQFILISTVDVFRDPRAVDEDSAVEEEGLHPYGLHRRRLEQFVQQRFADHLVLRLPGLVGPGLRKNLVYDLQHGRALDGVDSRATYQFYPMVNLWQDIAVALAASLPLVHLAAQPLSVEEVAREGFGRRFTQVLPGPVPAYDMRSRHAALWGATGAYQSGRRESLQAIRAYAQSEPPCA